MSEVCFGLSFNSGGAPSTDNFWTFFNLVFETIDQLSDDPRAKPKGKPRLHGGLRQEYAATEIIAAYVWALKCGVNTRANPRLRPEINAKLISNLRGVTLLSRTNAVLRFSETEEELSEFEKRRRQACPATSFCAPNKPTERVEMALCSTTIGTTYISIYRGDPEQARYHVAPRKADVYLTDDRRRLEANAQLSTSGSVMRVEPVIQQRQRELTVVERSRGNHQHQAQIEAMQNYIAALMTEVNKENVHRMMNNLLETLQGNAKELVLDNEIDDEKTSSIPKKSTASTPAAAIITELSPKIIEAVEKSVVVNNAAIAKAKAEAEADKIAADALAAAAKIAADALAAAAKAEVDKIAADALAAAAKAEADKIAADALAVVAAAATSSSAAKPAAAAPPAPPTSLNPQVAPLPPKSAAAVSSPPPPPPKSAAVFLPPPAISGNVSTPTILPPPVIE